MNRRELELLMQSRGYRELCSNGDLKNPKSISYFPIEFGKVVAHSVTVDLETKEFEFSYMTTRGCLHLTSGKCSPIDNEEHFNKIKNTFIEFSQVLKNYERGIL